MISAEFGLGAITSKENYPLFGHVYLYTKDGSPAGFAKARIEEGDNSIYCQMLLYDLDTISGAVSKTIAGITRVISRSNDFNNIYEFTMFVDNAPNFRSVCGIGSVRSDLCISFSPDEKAITEFTLTPMWTGNKLVTVLL